jgi:hypothetical protein
MATHLLSCGGWLLLLLVVVVVEEEEKNDEDDDEGGRAHENKKRTTPLLTVHDWVTPSPGQLQREFPVPVLLLPPRQG